MEEEENVAKQHFYGKNYFDPEGCECSFVRSCVCLILAILV